MALFFLLYSISGKKFAPLTRNNERVALIIISWLMMVLMGALPYLISKTIPSIVDILFETISGFTTTGTSILPDIEGLPKSLLFWRSITHWFGGIATILMAITVMTSLNIGGSNFFSMELLSGKGTHHNIRFIVTRVFMIYIVMTAAQASFLCAGGMTLFESLCHSFGTVSNGSFSPKNEGIAGYPTGLQYITVPFMFLSGISYLAYYQIIIGKYHLVRKNEEIRFYAAVILFATIFTSGILHFESGRGLGTAFTESLFQVVSLVSSSGYTTTDYLSWPDYILPMLYLLLVVGGCTGSASGGIKMARLLTLLRNFRQQMKNPVSASNMASIKFGRKDINEDTNLSILTFISIFGVVFVLGTIALSIFVADLKKSVFLAISALANFGHGLNISDLPGGGKLILSLLMLIGRLEIFPLLLLFVPSFYKKE
jgi:trk system potassium uptake protein TrkH